MNFQGIPLSLHFVQGSGGYVTMPADFGVYAEIYWPTLHIRIGESKNVRARNLAAIRWAEKHRLGLHSPKETSRRGPIVDLVKRWGSHGLEHFLISNDQRLFDRVVRVECEKFLHAWASKQTDFNNLNRQRGYRTIN